MLTDPQFATALWSAPFILIGFLWAMTGIAAVVIDGRPM